MTLLPTSRKNDNAKQSLTNTRTQKLHKILLVDDEDDNALTLKLILEEASFAQVDVFNDPLVALSNFKPDYYELALLDIKMPKMNGFDLYHEMKKKEVNKKDIKVCFITAYEIYYESLKKDFPSLEVGCFISKMSPIEDIVAHVKQELAQDK